MGSLVEETWGEGGKPQGAMLLSSSCSKAPHSFGMWAYNAIGNIYATLAQRVQITKLYYFCLSR